MGTELPVAPLESLCDLIADCPHSTPKWTTNGVVVLRSQNIRGGRLDLSSASYTDEEHYAKRIRRAEPNQGDLIITREAPMGEVCEIPPGLRCCLGQRMVLLRPARSKVNGRYLLYALQSNPVQEQIRWSEGTGSTVSNLRIPYLKELQIPAPTLPEQHSIADILGTLDDKIELNRQMTRTLEAVARAIFKAWFVDFEPVKAKAAGATGFRGMPQAVFDQLPGRLTDTELGPVPEGWDVIPLSGLVELIGGGTPKRKMAEYWSGDIPWFSVRDAPNEGDVWVIDTEEKITEEGVDNSSAKVMKPGTSIISARGTVGRLALTAVPMAMNQSCYGVIGKNGVGDYFVYLTLHHAVVELQQRTHGSVFDTITRKTFDGLNCIHPQSEILKGFEEVVGPYMMKIRANLFENGLLSNIRDALLPKLISGELRVPAAAGGADGG